MFISTRQFSLRHFRAAVPSLKEPTESDTCCLSSALLQSSTACKAPSKGLEKHFDLGQQNITTTCRVHHCVMILGSDWSICEKQITMPPASVLMGIVWGLMNCLSSSERCPGNTPLPGSQQKSLSFVRGSCWRVPERKKCIPTCVFWSLRKSHNMICDFLKSLWIYYHKDNISILFLALQCFTFYYYFTATLWQILGRHFLLIIFLHKQISDFIQ